MSIRQYCNELWTILKYIQAFCNDRAFILHRLGQGNGSSLKDLFGSLNYLKYEMFSCLFLASGQVSAVQERVSRQHLWHASRPWMHI